MLPPALDMPGADDWPASAALRRVLYDPVSYLHPQRRPPQHPRGNDWLVAAHGLQLSCPTLSWYARRWVGHWLLLPQVALALGCQLERDALGWGGAWLGLPGWARNFALLDPGHPPSAPSRPQHPADPLLSGYRLLLGHALQQLPPPLLQRLPLLFPPRCDGVAVAPQPLQTLWFDLALLHAQNHPDPAAVGCA